MKTKSFRILVSAIFLAMFMVVSATLSAKAAPAALPVNFVLISGGEFTMGSPVDEAKRLKNETRHQVRLSSFYISKYEVTVAEFRRFVVASGYKTDRGELFNMFNNVLDHELAVSQVPGDQDGIHVAFEYCKHFADAF